METHCDYKISNILSNKKGIYTLFRIYKGNYEDVKEEKFPGSDSFIIVNRYVRKGIVLEEKKESSVEAKEKEIKDDLDKSLDYKKGDLIIVKKEKSKLEKEVNK